MTGILAVIVFGVIAILAGFVFLGWLLETLKNVFSYLLKPYQNWVDDHKQKSKREAEAQKKLKDQKERASSRLNEYLNWCTRLGFEPPVDLNQELSLFSEMSERNWRSLLEELEFRSLEIEECNVELNIHKKKIEERIKAEVEKEIQSKAQKPSLPTFEREVFENKNIFLAGDTQSVGFYKEFLINLLVTPLPVKVKKLLEVIDQKEPLLALNNEVEPVLNLKKTGLKPHKKEKRYYQNSQFDELAFNSAMLGWEKLVDHNIRMKKNFKNEYTEFRLRILKEERAKIEAELAKTARRSLIVTCKAYIDGLRSYDLNGFKGLEDVVSMQLSRLSLPDYFPKKWDIRLDIENRILVIDFWLPPKASLEFVKERKQLKTRAEVKVTKASAKDQENVYNEFMYQISLGLTHLIFRADYQNSLEALGFNGIIEAPDEATGIVTENCILSFLTRKDEFMKFDLSNVVPAECFKKLKGVSSSTMSKMTAVRPVLKFNRVDKRFIEAREVIDHVDGVNLAAIHWGEFEALVRDIFSKEFSSDGAEVKITRASKDGGVDAVVFDPDPIKGGKFIVQAKRYTNVVGVSAVRDLYGTVMNEGANRGILVTTASYGPDAYEFAKDKPLTLINGSELLHLLNKHGYSARIDLKEAKEILKASGDGS